MMTRGLDLAIHKEPGISRLFERLNFGFSRTR